MRLTVSLRGRATFGAGFGAHFDCHIAGLFPASLRRALSRDAKLRLNLAAGGATYDTYIWIDGVFTGIGCAAGGALGQTFANVIALQAVATEHIAAAVLAGHLATIGLHEQAHATARLWTEHTARLQNKLLGGEALVTLVLLA